MTVLAQGKNGSLLTVATMISAGGSDYFQAYIPVVVPSGTRSLYIQALQNSDGSSDPMTFIPSLVGLGVSQYRNPTVIASGASPVTPATPSPIEYLSPVTVTNGTYYIGALPPFSEFDVPGTTCLSFSYQDPGGGNNFAIGIFATDGVVENFVETAGMVTLAGDVTGAANANTLAKIQGKPVVLTSLTSGDILQYNGTDWVNVTESGGAPGGSTGDVQFNNASDFDGDPSVQIVTQGTGLGLGLNPQNDNDTALKIIQPSTPSADVIDIFANDGVTLMASIDENGQVNSSAFVINGINNNNPARYLGTSSGDPTSGATAPTGGYLDGDWFTDYSTTSIWLYASGVWSQLTATTGTVYQGNTSPFDVPPAVPNAFNDEFTNAATETNWTATGSASFDIDTTKPGGLFISATNATNSLSKPCPTSVSYPCEFTTKLTGQVAQASGVEPIARFGVYDNPTSPTNYVVIATVDVTSGTNPLTVGVNYTGGYTTPTLCPWTGPLYFHIVFPDATHFQCFISADGFARMQLTGVISTSIDIASSFINYELPNADYTSTQMATFQFVRTNAGGEALYGAGLYPATVSPVSPVTLVSSATTQTPLTIEGDSGQIERLLLIENSSEDNLLNIGSSGHINLAVSGSGVPTINDPSGITNTMFSGSSDSVLFVTSVVGAVVPTTLGHVTFAKAYDHAPRSVILQSYDANSAVAGLFVFNVTSTGFDIDVANGSAITSQTVGVQALIMG